MTLEEQQAQALRIFQAVNDATRAIIAAEAQANPLSANTLLLGAAAAVSATIDMIEISTSGKMSREHALGVMMIHTVNNMGVVADVVKPEGLDG